MSVMSTFFNVLISQVSSGSKLQETSKNCMDQQYAPLIFTLHCQLQHPRGLELLCQPPGTSLALPCLLCFGVPIFNTNQDHIGSTNTFAKTCANIVEYLPSLYLATLTSFSYHFIIFRFRFLCSLYIHYLILNLLPQPPQQHLWHRCLAAVRQTAWHPKEPGIRYVLRLEKSVFTQRRKSTISARSSWISMCVSSNHPHLLVLTPPRLEAVSRKPHFHSTTHPKKKWFCGRKRPFAAKCRSNTLIWKPSNFVFGRPYRSCCS